MQGRENTYNKGKAMLAKIVIEELEIIHFDGNLIQIE